MIKAVESGPVITPVAYEKANLTLRSHKGSGYRYHKDGIYDYGSWNTIKNQILKIVKVEGPIHKDILYERIRDSWMMKNATSKLKSHIDNIARQTRVVRDSSDFFWASSEKRISSYRNIGEHRDSKHVSKEEVALVFQAIFDVSRGTIGKDEIQRLTSQIFGWGKRTAKVTRKLDEALNHWKLGNSIKD